MAEKVVITCPKTGVQVETGIEIAERNFATIDVKSRFKCPACGKIHTWSKKDASLKKENNIISAIKC